MSEPVAVEPLARPPDATLDVPGSKSLTNRAVLCAALAEGTSTLTGALVADDSEAMVDAVVALGAQVTRQGEKVRVVGTGGQLPDAPLTVDARDAGTVARFVLPVLATGAQRHRLDGSAQLRRRPLGPLVHAVRQLGGQVDDTGGSLPVSVRGPVTGRGVQLPGDVSSQFVSGLLLAGPLMPHGVTVELTTPLVARPFVEMTAAVMRSFGADATVGADRCVVPPGRYLGADYTVEPDASAASYFLAAAAITGGRVRVRGLGRGSAQGDLGLLEVLERMGADTVAADTYVEARGGVRLRGVDVDLRDLPDMAPTVAALAAFAEGATRVRGIAFVRGHESDRIAAVVDALRRVGVEAVEHEDGFEVRPAGPPHGGVVDPHGDHRLAMAFALLGLRVPGVAIADGGVVAKTFPGYFDVLASLRR